MDADLLDAGDGLSGVAPTPLLPVDEEEEQLMRNFGSNALMSRVQDALRKQLEEQLARVEADLRAAEESRDASKLRREDVGVELYGVQQQLARLQSDLDAKSASIADLAARRSANDAALAQFEEATAMRRAGVASAEAALESLKGELDGIADTQRQVGALADEVGGEIALARRAALKADSATREGETAKSAQDVFIDGLVTQVRRAGEASATLQAQVDASRGEADVAAATIAEATTEMETIRLEKKQLMLQWQSTLLQLRKRDEALAAIAKTITASQIEIDAMGAEDGNVKKAMLVTQSVHAAISDSLEREEADLRQTEASTAALMRQGEALSARRSALAGTLEGTEAEAKRAAVETGRLLKAVKELDNERAAADRQRFGLEDEITTALTSRATNEKATKAQLKEMTRLLERSHALDLAKAEAENAVAGARVEALTASSRLASLREALAGMTHELEEKEALAVKCELEIRQRNEAVQKKMSIVDRLNRKWEKLVDGAPTEENVGPLAAEVISLGKSIEESRVESESLQRRWLVDQSALVSVVTETEVRRTRLTEVSSEATLLRQKAIRLDRAIDAEKGDTRRLAGAVKGMRDDMARINALISKNAALRDRLSVATYSAEKAFSEELKDMEREASVADVRTQGLKEECARLMGDLVEAEKQVLAWEKKITLEKEMQDAIDPSVGESELSSLEREVHRMKLRHDALKRDQEKLIAEMERAVEKRDVIAQKHRSSRQATMEAAAATGKGIVAALGGSARLLATATRGKALEGDALTKVGLSHRAAALRAELATRMAALEDADAALNAQRAEAEGVVMLLRERTDQCATLEAAASAAQASLRSTLFSTQRAVERASASERMLARFLALEAGRLPSVGTSASDGAAVRARLREAEAGVAAARDVAQALTAAHPELSGAIARVVDLYVGE
jgi:chromosome segregation ATPase